MAQGVAPTPIDTYRKSRALFASSMVWLPDHIWRQQKQKGGGGKGGNSDVMQTLLKALSGGGGGKGWSGGGGKSWGKGGGWPKPKPKDTSGGELGEHIGKIKTSGYKFSF